MIAIRMVQCASNRIELLPRDPTRTNRLTQTRTEAKKKNCQIEYGPGRGRDSVRQPDRAPRPTPANWLHVEWTFGDVSGL